MPILKRKIKPKKAITPKQVLNSTASRRSQKKIDLPENTWERAQTAEGWRRARLLEM